MKKESIQDRKNWEQTHLEEIPSEPKFLFLKQQRLLSVLQFNTKTEYKPQLSLNKKLLKQMYTTFSVFRIITDQKLNPETKIPNIPSAWHCWIVSEEHHRMVVFASTFALKKIHNRTSHKGGATLKPLFFQCCQVIALVHSNCIIKFIPWAIGTDVFLCNWVTANILVFGPAKSICSSLWKDCIFKLKKKSSLKTAFVPKPWKFGKLNCKI